VFLVVDCAEADPPLKTEAATAAVAVNDPRKNSRRLLVVIRPPSHVVRNVQAIAFCHPEPKAKDLARGLRLPCFATQILHFAALRSG
jgi:hypothetical protein